MRWTIPRTSTATGDAPFLAALHAVLRDARRRAGTGLAGAVSPTSASRRRPAPDAARHPRPAPGVGRVRPALRREPARARTTGSTSHGLGWSASTRCDRRSTCERRARDARRGLGYTGEERPDDPRQVLPRPAHRLDGDRDRRPCRCRRPSRSRRTPTDGRNYLAWLADAAARRSTRSPQQDGFTDDRPPTRAALPAAAPRPAARLLRHQHPPACEQPALSTPTRSRAARSDAPFLHVASRSRASARAATQLLYARERRSPATGDCCSATTSRAALAAARRRYLREQSQALERLARRADRPARARFADHVDCCAYRLDAWLPRLRRIGSRRMRDAATATSTGRAAPAAGSTSAPTPGSRTCDRSRARSSRSTLDERAGGDLRPARATRR